MAVRIVVFWLIFLMCSQSFAGSNTEPMYGSTPLTAEQEKLNREFVESVLSSGVSREAAAKLGVKRGFEMIWAKDFETSMKRFNQAWLLDPDNGDIYYGFALLSAHTSKADDVVEKFFKQSFGKSETSTTAFSDYGWFLITTGRFDEAQKVLEEHQDAFNALSHLAFLFYLKKDFAKACEWAIAAEKAGHTLEPGFKDDMCSYSLG